MQMCTAVANSAIAQSHSIWNDNEPSEIIRPRVEADPPPITAQRDESRIFSSSAFFFLAVI